LIVLTAFHIPAKIKQRTWFRALLFALWLIALYALMASFSLIGHTAELNIRVQIALSLHVLVVAWWMGGLWPLWLSCKELDSEGLHSLMHRFGQLAQVAVAVLIATGVFLAIQLLGSVSALWLTDYGQIFLLKLVGVSAILLIGLYHKVRLTPELISKPESSYRLARSIQIEMFVGLLVLLTTAVLTTLVGPSHAL
ncbi:MAG: CopD family protein, partial [Pseudomonadales bacterium]